MSGTVPMPSGLHEMVANAMVMEGEKKREVNYRGEPLPGMEDSEDV